MKSFIKLKWNEKFHEEFWIENAQYSNILLKIIQGSLIVAGW